MIAHRDEAPNSCPETVVRQLLPAPSVRHRPLVENTTSKVHGNSNKENEGEHSARSNAPGLGGLDAGARMLAAHDEHVGALIGVRADKRDGSRGIDTIAVAAERDGRGLPSYLLGLLDQHGVVVPDSHSIQGAGVGAVARAPVGRRRCVYCIVMICAPFLCR